MLPPLGGNRSHASGIDDGGTIVGAAKLANGSQVPTIWHDLQPANVLSRMVTPTGWVLTTAVRAGPNGSVIFYAKQGTAVACAVGFPMP